MLDTFISAALSAGRAIMNVHANGPEAVYKDDCSPVTEADQRAEEIIIKALYRAFPTVPIIAEEQAAAGIIPKATMDFFLVDPLDGTKEFITGKQDFTVNIALIRNTVPVIGIVYAPALKTAWTSDGTKAEKLYIGDDFTIIKREPIECRHCHNNSVAVISRSHSNDMTNAYIQDHQLINTISIGSSLKFCMLAEGIADIYPRFSRTMLWDTAAGDAVLRAAGGMTTDLNGAPLQYRVNPQDHDFLANPHFIAYGKRA